MDTDKILIELETKLKEKLNSVSKNETYSKLLELYPVISVDKIISNLNNDLLKFNTFTEIASLVEQYKKISDYIANIENNSAVTKLNNLFSVLGEELLDDNIKQLGEIKVQQKRIKQRLDDLGFKSLSLFKSRHQIESKQTFANKISAGGYHTVGIKSDGTVVAVGENEYGQCNVSCWTDIVAVSAGYSHTVGLKSDGTVVANGDNRYGQCRVNGWTDIVAVSAGYSHTVGLKSDGTVVAIGDNRYGQCRVNGWTDIVAISAGAAHTIGLKSDGTVVAVGDNYMCKCAVYDWRGDVVAVSAGEHHTIALKSDGTVIAVGGDWNGRCTVDYWENTVAVSAGGAHTIGLKSDGTVVAVGSVAFGQSDVDDWNLFS